MDSVARRELLTKGGDRRVGKHDSIKGVDASETEGFERKRIGSFS
jgi:hypothetical protein